MDDDQTLWVSLRRRATLRLLAMHHESGVGHIGGNLSCLDLMLALHHELMGPRDQFLLSKGHAAGAYYVTLWTLGRLDDGDLRTFHKDDTRLSGHPPTSGIDDIHFATGSLGHGLSLASGLALAKRFKKEDGRVYCLMSDGEWNEGSSWEALIFARHQGLDNLTIVVDLNGLQGFGTTREVADLDPLAEKFEAFGVPTRVIDGHDHRAIVGALREAGQDGLSVVVARTRKGCGVSFMEDRMEWHYLPLSESLYRQAVLEIEPRMRDIFCRTLVAASRRPDFVFLTGDLGYKALEPLRDALGDRFVNAGVAEQNMVTVAAGLARSGLRPWVYSIAPFLYARPFEQIRNDVCLHRLPVVMVGNGGGYGYGVMGATHHALEDYGSLLCLPHLRAYIPAFDEDLDPLFAHLFDTDKPAYLRLGLSELPKGTAAPSYAPWRKLLGGRGWVVLVTGPLVGGIWEAVRALDESRRPSLWLLGELPLSDLPTAFIDDLARSRRLLVVEEHVAHGGVGQMVATALLARGLAPERFETRGALGYVSGRYGSQKFHRRECGLDPASVVQFLNDESG